MAEGHGGELTVEASVNANIIPKISTKVKFEGNEISTQTCLSDKCDINKFVVLFQDSYIFFDETGQQKLTKCKIMILGSIINSTLVLTPSFVNFNIRPKSEEDKPFNGQLKFGIKCKNPEIKKLLPEKEFHSYWSSQRVEFEFPSEVVPKFVQLFGEISFDFIPGKPLNWGILKPMESREDPKCFIIKSHEKEWAFDQNILCRISPVFEAMLLNPRTIECQKNQMNLEGVSEEILDVFHNLMTKWTDTAIYEFCMGFTNSGIIYTKYDNEIISNLLVFADKYLMEPLIELCIFLITTSLRNENVLDVLKMAHFLNNQKLLKIATAFSINNCCQENLSEDQQKEWNEFISLNPNCVAKMMTSLVMK